MLRPLIGVTLDAEKPGGYSKFPWYALRQNYLDAIDAAGGLAVALPHEPDRVADYLERIDALVVTGGAFDVDPSYYGAADPKGGGIEHGPCIFSQPTCHHKPEVYGGIAEREAGDLLRAFFRERR